MTGQHEPGRVAPADQAELDRLRGEVRELGEEVAQLTRALASRDIIGQAKGLIMAAVGGTGERAFAVLLSESQHTNRKLRDVAAALVDRPDRRQAAAALAREAADLARSEFSAEHEVTGTGEPVLAVRLRGDLDATTAGALDRVLAASPERVVVVDLTGLDFADLRGLRPLVRAARSGRSVRLRHVPEFLRRLLAMQTPQEGLTLD